MCQTTAQHLQEVQVQRAHATERPYARLQSLAQRSSPPTVTCHCRHAHCPPHSPSSLCTRHNCSISSAYNASHAALPPPPPSSARHCAFSAASAGARCERACDSAQQQLHRQVSASGVAGERQRFTRYSRAVYDAGTYDNGACAHCCCSLEGSAVT